MNKCVICKKEFENEDYRANVCEVCAMKDLKHAADILGMTYEDYMKEREELYKWEDNENEKVCAM